MTIGFSMAILLAISALRNCALWSSRLKDNFAVHKVLNIVNMLITGIWKKLYHKKNIEKYGHILSYCTQNVHSCSLILVAS